MEVLVPLQPNLSLKLEDLEVFKHLDSNEFSLVALVSKMRGIYLIFDSLTAKRWNQKELISHTISRNFSGGFKIMLIS